MAQEKTLYDLLEVSNAASTEAITAAYERLKAKYLAGNLDSAHLDPETHFNLIKDAFQTLSSAERRQRYDSRRKPSAAPEPLVSIVAESPAGPGHHLKWAALVLVALGIGSYFYFSHKVELERQRIASEVLRLEEQRMAQEAAERAAAAELAMAQQARNDKEQEEAQRRADQQRAEYEIRSASRQADRNLYAQDSQQRQSERDLQRSQQRAQYEQEAQRRRDEYEARARLAKDQNYLRQLERENHRGSGGIPSSH